MHSVVCSYAIQYLMMDLDMFLSKPCASFYRKAMQNVLNWMTMIEWNWWRAKWDARCVWWKFYSLYMNHVFWLIFEMVVVVVVVHFCSSHFHSNSIWITFNMTFLFGWLGEKMIPRAGCYSIHTKSIKINLRKFHPFEPFNQKVNYFWMHRSGLV